MKPQNQIFFVAKDGHGDCYRCAVATLLNMPAKRVPHVFWDAAGYHVGVKRMRDWLWTKLRLRLITMTVFYDTPDELLSEMANTNPDEFYILIGVSKHGSGHAVVCKGGAIVHDPNPQKTGIVAPFYKAKRKGVFEVHIVSYPS